MAFSNTEICNMALSHLGTGKEISDLETEKSQEASACRRFYSVALEFVLRDFDWGFARKQVSLALVDTFSQGSGSEFSYSYRYPNACAKIRKIMSGFRQDTESSRVVFQESSDAVGKLLLTNAPASVQYPLFVEITRNDQSPEVWPPDFVMAISYMLASLIAPRLTSGDPMKLGDKALQKYFVWKSKAEANDLSESVPDIPYDSEFVRVRS